MKKINVKFIANVGIFSALGLVFDLIAKMIGFDPWQAGGSISLAMVPIFLMAYYYGTLGGVFTGFIIGTIQIIWGTPAGILGAMLDYVLPYTCVGLCGIFINKKRICNSKGIKYFAFSVSMLISGMLRIFFHTLSGVVLYEVDCVASFIYNAPYVLLSVVICGILTIILIDRLDFIFIGKDKDDNDLYDEMNNKL